SSTATLKLRAAPATRQLSPALSFLLFASLTVSFLAGSSAPTPLYPVYIAKWGLTPLMITVIFGIYALAVLVALLVAGRLSDHLGRRPVLLTATLAQAATMILFVIATSSTGLIIARIIQGITTGAALGAIGAALIDLDKTRGAVANSVAPPFGTATGAIVAGVLVQYLPFPTHLVYIVFALVFILQAIALSFVAETISPPRNGNVLASLKPQLKLPRATREPLLLALPVLVAVWSLGAFYGSLSPLLVRTLVGWSSPLLGGLGLFVLAASGGIAILILQHREPKQLMTSGVGSLLAGTAIAVGSLPYDSIPLFFFGTAVAGVGFGTGFQGAVRTVVSLAAPHERAGVLSIMFIISYIALGAPAVVAGWMVARHWDILATAQIFGVVVMALAGAVLLGNIWRSATTRLR
ncbi:MAG: MFS transporter, partial [Acetobacteraceae bacterium]|nr:MFS transporter [Acetobacteraceae bacterium]